MMPLLACGCGGVGEYAIVAMLLAILAKLGVRKKQQVHDHRTNDQGSD